MPRLNDLRKDERLLVVRVHLGRQVRSRHVGIVRCLCMKMLQNSAAALRMPLRQIGERRSLRLCHRRHRLPQRATYADLGEAAHLPATAADAVVAALGGELGAQAATTYITPGVPGRQEYDLYPRDIAGAEALLAGKSVPGLVLLTDNGAAHRAVAEAVGQSLKEAGLQITIDPAELILKALPSCDVARQVGCSSPFSEVGPW